MEFEWEPAKHERNLLTRGMGFDEAALFFEGEVITWPDARADYGEVRWDAVVTSDNGLFAGGKAANFSLAFACGLIECSVVEASGTVQMSRSGK